jgi:NAD-dependent deacetylase
MEQLLHKIGQLKTRLYGSHYVAALTGAGISAESGVPTFRGKNGLWKQYRVEDLATADAFTRDPKLVWDWYNWRRQLIASRTYNAAHHALAELEKKCSQFTLITQNVDSLHKKAGSENVLEIHGNIWKVRCTACKHMSENYEVPLEILPHCEMCGGLLRPHVVWFGEPLPSDVLEQAQRALDACDFLMVIGTSGNVHPVASFPHYARAKGAFVLEVNLERTPISAIAHETILGKAGEIIPLLV